MKRRILIVDDDPDMVRTLRDIFRIRGWETGVAYSGAGAIDAQKAQPFDRVLMDVRMPGIDGVAASKVLRRLFPRLPVVLMTAHQVTDVDETSTPVLIKPIDFPTLFALLDRNAFSSR